MYYNYLYYSTSVFLLSKINFYYPTVLKNPRWVAAQSWKGSFKIDPHIITQVRNDLINNKLSHPFIDCQIVKNFNYCFLFILQLWDSDASPNAKKPKYWRLCNLPEWKLRSPKWWVNLTMMPKSSTVSCELITIRAITRGRKWTPSYRVQRPIPNTFPAVER